MSLDLQVQIDEAAGFCFGVQKAIERAEETLNQGDPLYCIGQIVHNQEEVSRLERLGMISISHDDLPRLSGVRVLIRSHGEPPETYETLRKNDNEIIEATCPVVLKLQQRVRQSADSGEFVLIFGKKNHPEVIGLTGQLESPFVVFQHVDELDLCRIPQRITLYSQTTMDLEAFQAASRYLQDKGFQVTVKDTVCRKVSGKKAELSRFARTRDVVIMVAGKQSSNGKVLYEVCLESNPRSYSVTLIEEIKTEWFRAGESVGITGATSTPRWQMETIAAYIASL